MKEEPAIHLMPMSLEDKNTQEICLTPEVYSCITTKKESVVCINATIKTQPKLSTLMVNPNHIQIERTIINDNETKEKSTELNNSNTNAENENENEESHYDINDISAFNLDTSFADSSDSDSETENNEVKNDKYKEQ